MARGTDFEIVQWNCRNLHHNKTPVHQYLLIRPSLPHFLLLQETRTAPGYRAYHATMGTPLASVYVRNDVLVEPLDIPSSLLKYLVGVVYYQPSSRISLALISFYNPPVTCSLFTALGKFLHSLASTTHLLLGGDFNAPHTLWGYPQTLKPGRLLHCLAQERHLTLLNNSGSPTRAGTVSQRSTTPDLTFSRGALSLAVVSASSRRVSSRHPIPDPDPHFLRLWRRRKRLQRSFHSQPQNAQLSSRITALRAEIVAHSASLEHARWSLDEAHACRVAHALTLNQFLYFVPYVSFTNTQINTLETTLLGLYKAALNLPITTSTTKLFATGLFHPLRSLLSLPRDSQLARLSLTRQGQWLLAQAGISPIPVSTFTSPICTPAPNLLCLPSCIAAVVTRQRSTMSPPLFTTQGVAYTDASFVAPRGSCGYAIYHPHLPAPETHTSGPFLHPPDALSLEDLAIAHALQSFPSLPSLSEYTIYSDSQAAIHHIENRTLPPSLQQEVERAPSENGGRLSLRRTIKEVYLQLRLDKCLYPPPHPSLTVPEARLLRHVQMNALVTPSLDPSCPNCPSTYADLAHCLFHCPAAQQSHSYPPSLSITTWLDWLGAEGMLAYCYPALHYIEKEEHELGAKEDDASVTDRLCQSLTIVIVAMDASTSNPGTSGVTRGPGVRAIYASVYSIQYAGTTHPPGSPVKTSPY
ncbi:hypothetical protein HPB49_018150 [Dermacentor silvarum]|uniref:Uncharacterized protein n=1 Tax=Dermacentor silvarum TaxID=543639 RepID=A0ACB8DKD6_DERSI|nr:hypothetical protein HPB49_018150 [Dermacentor silvarum]